MVELALQLASKGLCVFPVTPGKKDPPITGWPEKATNKPEEVKRLWSRWPDANIGVYPGKSCLVVLDIDVRVADWKSSLEKLKGLGLSSTYTVKTVRGGWHLYYRHPGGGVIKASDKRWTAEFPGVEVKADGAYVMGPGSIALDNTYTVVSGDLSNPSWLPLEIVAKLPYKQKFFEGVGSPHDNVDFSDYSVVPTIVKVGERDKWFYGLACSLVGRGIPIQEAADVVKAHWQVCEQPPKDIFTLQQALAKLERAYSEYAPNKPSLKDKIEETEALKDHSLQDLLTRYVLIEDSSEVANLQGNTLPISLAAWKTARKNLLWEGKEISCIWLANEGRKTVFTKTYCPRPDQLILEDNMMKYNTYIPPKLNIPPDGYYDQSKINVVLDHLQYLFSEDGIGLFNRWLAFTVFRPEVRIPWAPLLISSYHGVGKGLLYHILAKLLGSTNCHRIDPSDLVNGRDTFNEWLRGTLLWIDELTPKFDFYERLKPIITETRSVINNKWGARTHCQIYCNVICATNHSDALKIDDYDRRFWVVQHNEPPLPSLHYKSILSWLETVYVGHLVNYLKANVNLDEFNPGVPPPKNAAKDKVISQDRSELDTIILSAYAQEIDVFNYDMTSIDLVADFITRSLNVQIGRKERYQISRVLHKLDRSILPQDTYVITNRRNRKLIHPVIIRNGRRWRTESKSAIIKYLESMLQELAINNTSIG